MSLLRKLGTAAAVALFLGAAMPAEAQIFVKIRPPRPHVTVRTPRPPRPAGAVWVEEDWRGSGDRYEYAGGRWETPTGSGMVWRPGHWKNTPRRGYVWVPGHWGGRRHY